MRRGLWILAGVILFGCDMPEMSMVGVPAQVITVQGSTFSVYIRGTEAEAIRTNFEYGSKAKGVMQRGYIAIQAVSGCDIIPGSFGGDPARMVARLTC